VSALTIGPRDGAVPFVVAVFEASSGSSRGRVGGSGAARSGKRIRYGRLLPGGGFCDLVGGGGVAPGAWSFVKFPPAPLRSPGAGDGEGWQMLEERHLKDAPARADVFAGTAGTGSASGAAPTGAAETAHIIS
jgi:hypothetical protein